MNISAPFIARPVATMLLSIAVLLAGAFGYLRLPVSALPEVDFPTIEVTTQLPGASPETVALLVTASLERQLAQIAGLTDIVSTSGPGTSRITLQFTLDRNIDDAAQDVQAAINAARGTLPASLPYPPTYAKVNPADPPIITLALTSDTLPIHRLSDAADSLLAQRLSQVSGVGRVIVQGNMRPAVRVQADPTRLAAYGLSLEDVRTAIAAGNVNTPKGSIDGPRQASAIMANDQIRSPEAFSELIITWRNGAPVRLRDIGGAVLDLENVLNGAWYNGAPAVLVDVQRQPGANIVGAVRDVRAQLAMLERALPQGARLHVVADRTETIRASVHDVQFTLALAVFLVVAVIWLFLRSGRATVIAGVALPLSIIGTFGVMAVCGFSLNNLSLMALTIATGFVVDDAIVMIENIVRLIEGGKKPLQAAFEGARQIGFTVVSLTVSLVAVFIPLLFMPGVVGRLFQEFALTLTIAVTVSMFVSLTLTPMMCARLLRPADTVSTSRIGAAFERGFDRLRDGYARSLHLALRHEGLMLLLATLTVAGTVALYVVMPKGFLPQQDTGLIVASVEGPDDVSFGRMAELQRQVAEVIRSDPAVAAVTSVVGAGVVNPASNTGRVTAVLVPRDLRADNAHDIALRLQPRLDALSGTVVQLQPVQDIQIGARPGSTAYQYTLMGPDPAELGRWAPRLEARMAALPILRDVGSDQRDGGLRVTLDVDRDLAGRLGVTMQAIDDTLYNAFGQRQISTIYAQNNQYRVVLEATPGVRDDPAMIGMLRVPATAGLAATAQGTPVQAPAGTPQVPLAEIARIGRAAGPLTVTKQGQFPAITLGFDLAPGASLGEAVAAIRAAEAELGMPATIAGSFAGDAAEFQRSLRGEPWLILAALIVIYIVLGVLYESVIHPVTIISTLPSAGIGALLALRLFDLDLSVVGLIGIVLLMGIVKKNAIMMIDFALEAQRDHGRTPREAITEASILRFRPIMMTTMAALLGALPLVLESGTGSELRLPLGVSVVGGLLLSQVITLYTTPVVYLAMEQLRERARRLARRPRPVAAE
ncbi:acriflavine resistance protein B [Siccirubricoccus deserti]|uniref:Efflux RND transporter permease subunit n=1 Tax=Siccirubricoccus deserti TaxID=2013562 RepID=A0A9X0R3L9_9PROT|nr:efflux RND transporter permease subunit [Siccirubricoccus deserti]MBC4017808.1 efflux RND transporter permease subunit [Siccirubricoccus deserti]GGC61247.1 acriflavine resistance protein B [Siccirubricoccus deserti]